MASPTTLLYGSPCSAPCAGSSTSPSSGDDDARSPAVPVLSVSVAAPVAALPSSAWLQWEGGAPPADMAAHLPEGALALRRQKNRESMRRARQRQRDQLQQLRDAVSDLEQQYARLSTRAESNASAISVAADSRESRAIEDARALARRLGAENLLLRATLQDQQDWKLEMRRVFETTGYLLGGTVDKTVAFDDDEDTPEQLTLPPSSGAAAPTSSNSNNRFRRARQTVSSAQSLAPLREQLEVLSTFEAESVFGFRPLAKGEVKDLILDNTRVVARVQSLLEGSAPNDNESDDSLGGMSPSSGEAASPLPLNLDQDPNALHMDVFGWDVRQLVRGDEMLFSFTKKFPTLAVAEVMQRAWSSELTLSGMQKVKYDTIALAPLQVVDENAVVLGRDVRSPDEKPLFRTTMLRYRLETTRDVVADEDDGSVMWTGNGFVIGTQSLNPHKHAGAVLAPDLATLYRGRAEDGRADGTPPGTRLVWADLSYSIEFLRVVDRQGRERFAQVRWAGKTNYGSPFDARRNTSDKLSSLLHWELQNIAPAIHFLTFE